MFLMNIKKEESTSVSNKKLNKFYFMKKADYYGPNFNIYHENPFMDQYLNSLN